jgi:hypothetical protein
MGLTYIPSGIYYSTQGDAKSKPQTLRREKMKTLKKATDAQIIAVAKLHDAIGDNSQGLYGVTDGKKTKYAVSCYRDSFHNLAKAGILRYNGDYTYSLNAN